VRAEAPCLWSAHLARLNRGAERLGIPSPDPALLRAETDALLIGVETGVLRITLTRGPGGRGYRPPPRPEPTRILALYPAAPDPGRWRAQGANLTLCRAVLGTNPLLAGIKHLNRLEQVLARAEWDDPEIIDGVMTDSQGRVTCGTMSNLFLCGDNGIETPAVDRCGVAGTVRALVLRHAAALGIPAREADIPLATLARARGLFLTNALLGPLPVARVGPHRFDPRAVPAELLERVRDAAFQPEIKS
jgi:4-amino-4-deoxychorismate lyase